MARGMGDPPDRPYEPAFCLFWAGQGPAPTIPGFVVDGHVQQTQTVFGPDNELGERKVRPYKSVFFS
jgi:hypothetical protein